MATVTSRNRHSLSVQNQDLESTNTRFTSKRQSMPFSPEHSLKAYETQKKRIQITQEWKDEAFASQIEQTLRLERFIEQERERISRVAS